MVMAYPDMDPRSREIVACDHFVNSLTDPKIKEKVRDKNPTTMDEALKAALLAEVWAKESVSTEVRNDDRTKLKSSNLRAVGHNESDVLYKKLDDIEHKFSLKLTNLENKFSQQPNQRQVGNIPRPSEPTSNYPVPVRPPPVCSPPFSGRPNEALSTQAMPFKNVNNSWHRKDNLLGMW
jgi:hypothetical protein